NTVVVQTNRGYRTILSCQQPGHGADNSPDTAAHGLLCKKLPQQGGVKVITVGYAKWKGLCRDRAKIILCKIGFQKEMIWMCVGWCALHTRFDIAEEHRHGEDIVQLRGKGMEIGFKSGNS